MKLAVWYVVVMYQRLILTFFSLLSVCLVGCAKDLPKKVDLNGETFTLEEKKSGPSFNTYKYRSDTGQITVADITDAEAMTRYYLMFAMSMKDKGFEIDKADPELESLIAHNEGYEVLLTKGTIAGKLRPVHYTHDLDDDRLSHYEIFDELSEL